MKLKALFLLLAVAAISANVSAKKVDAEEMGAKSERPSKLLAAGRASGLTREGGFREALINKARGRGGSTSDLLKKGASSSVRTGLGALTGGLFG